MKRSDGDNTDGEFHKWAVGYKGAFYETLLTESSLNFQWKFDGQITDCTYKEESYTCECSNAENSVNNDIFDVTCSNTEFKTVIELKRDLTVDDTSKEVTIRNKNAFNEFNTKFISVSSKVLIIFFVIL